VDPICELQPQAPRRPILRRDPSSSILHRILERHAPAFWAACEQRGRHYPPFVQRQLSSFARCGDPAHGFARIYCPHCRREELLAFSCKVRQLCPCCCARRMNAQAAHLVDHVLPTVPLRQWVLTVPFEIRALLDPAPTHPSPCPQNSSERPQIPRRALKRSPLAATATSTPSPTPRQAPSQPCRPRKVTPRPSPNESLRP
jgi:hypothetical protein